jgi:hypothetical protein
MKTLIHCLCFALFCSFGRADDTPVLVPVTPTVKTPAEICADSLVEALNNELKHRIAIHEALFADFWHNANATPDEINAALGNKAAAVFRASAENLAHLTRIAAIAGVSIDDLIPAEHRTSPRAVSIHTDGTVTLADP